MNHVLRQQVVVQKIVLAARKVFGTEVGKFVPILL